MIENRKGLLLIAVYMVITVLLVFLGIFVYKNIWEAKIAANYKQRLLSFYCAEAALDKGIAKLPSSTIGEANVALSAIGGSQQGEYTYSITTLQPNKKWRVESWGYVPSQAQAEATEHLEAYIAKKDLPNSFWENAIYTAGNVRINGNAYDIEGNIIHGGSLQPSTLEPANFTGTTTNDISISPLVKLDFESLRIAAAAQIKADGSDNVYTAAEIAAGNPPFPGDFWFDDSDANPANWIPNVVYVETDLILNGNIGTIGGFFLVVGDVTTNPSDTSETIINGNGQIDGCVYSTGQFRVNGGGGGLNVLGGVWSGTDGVRLNGNITIEYHQPYMDSIREVIQPSSIMQVVSWRKL
ncbi:MAG: hypothetical protein V1739_02260 [Candidatus Omnitrophota bacterium]